MLLQIYDRNVNIQAFLRSRIEICCSAQFVFWISLALEPIVVLCSWVSQLFYYFKPNGFSLRNGAANIESSAVGKWQSGSKVPLLPNSDRSRFFYFGIAYMPLAFIEIFSIKSSQTSQTFKKLNNLQTIRDFLRKKILRQPERTRCQLSPFRITIFSTTIQ